MGTVFAACTPSARAAVVRPLRVELSGPAGKLRVDLGRLWSSLRPWHPAA
jgi:hypothetical protein